MKNDMEGLCKLREIKSRSISPENFGGEKGRGGMAEEGTGVPLTSQEIGKSFVSGDR